MTVSPPRGGRRPRVSARRPHRGPARARLARRAASEQQPSTDEDVVVFHVEVPWSDALVPGRQIEIRPVRCSPASQLPTRFTIISINSISEVIHNAPAT